MKTIAEEVGLDPELIERAAHLVPGATRQTPMGRLFGGPLSSQVDLYVPVRLGREDAQRLLSLVRATLLTQGRGEATESGMSFSSHEGGRKVFIAAHSEGDGTRLRIAVDSRSRLALPLAVGPVGALMLVNLALPAAAQLGNPWAPYLVLGGGIAIGAGLLWTSVRKSVQRTLGTLDDLVGALNSFLRHEDAS